MALQGTLDTFALPDVLRLLASTRKSGRLVLDSRVHTGSVWFGDGQLLGAEAPHQEAPDNVADALFRLLRFSEGDFRFEPDELPEVVVGPLDVSVTLEEAESLLAEWLEIEQVIPTLRRWLTLVAEPAPDGTPVTLAPHEWRLVATLGSGMMVRDLALQLGLTELDACRSVKALVETGLVAVGEDAEPDPDELLFGIEDAASLSARERLDALASNLLDDEDAEPEMAADVDFDAEVAAMGDVGDVDDVEVASAAATTDDAEMTTKVGSDSERAMLPEPLPMAAEPDPFDELDGLGAMTGLNGSASEHGDDFPPADSLAGFLGSAPSEELTGHGGMPRAHELGLDSEAYGISFGEPPLIPASAEDILTRGQDLDVPEADPLGEMPNSGQTISVGEPTDDLAMATADAAAPVEAGGPDAGAPSSSDDTMAVDAADGTSIPAPPDDPTIEGETADAELARQLSTLSPKAAEAIAAAASSLGEEVLPGRTRLRRSSIGRR